jgi:flotillin
MVSEMVIVVVIMVMAMIVLMMVFAARYKKVPPDKVMVVYGRRMGPMGPGYKIISGGGKFIVPVVESFEFLPLDVRTLDIDMDDLKVISGEGTERIRLKVTAHVKISSDYHSLIEAAEHLLHKSDAEINEIARSTIEAHVRSICRSVTFDQLDVDRRLWATKVGVSANQDLLNMGLEIRSFGISQVSQ